MYWGQKMILQGEKKNFLRNFAKVSTKPREKGYNLHQKVYRDGALTNSRKRIGQLECIKAKNVVFWQFTETPVPMWNW